MRLAVVGADHVHLFEIVDRLVKAGAETVAHTADGSLVGAYADWRTDSVERSFDDILADDTIDLVVTAAIPNQRADIALAAIAAGKHVVTDKPGLTTMAQLDAIRAAVAGRPGRPWTVLFTERYENRAIAEAVRLARSGAVGPHRPRDRRRSAHDVGQAPPRLVLGSGGDRRDPRRHRLAPGRPVPGDHRRQRRRRRDRRRGRRQRRLARSPRDAGHRLDDPRRTRCGERSPARLPDGQGARDVGRLSAHDRRYRGHDRSTGQRRHRRRRGRRAPHRRGRRGHPARRHLRRRRRLGRATHRRPRRRWRAADDAAARDRRDRRLPPGPGRRRTVGALAR